MDMLKDELESRITTLESKATHCPAGDISASDKMKEQMVALEERIKSRRYRHLKMTSEQAQQSSGD